VKRPLTFNQALCEATRQMMQRHRDLVVFGEGVNDPKAIFGTTKDLDRDFPGRVLETPVSENAMTGIALGHTLSGGRSLLIHQRIDFALYGMDQLVNNVAKWKSMFALDQKIGLVIRAIIGQGWGQGHQHSQNLQSMFAMLPGLNVVTPSTPYSAKGLLIQALECGEPVLFLEHRWLQNIQGHVPDRMYRLPFDPAVVLKKGRHLTLVANGHWTLECFRAASFLETLGLECEIIDIRQLSGHAIGAIGTCVTASVAKTGHLLVIDGSWGHYGLASEIIAQVARRIGRRKTPAPQMDSVQFPFAYSPSASRAANVYFPNVETIVKAAWELRHRGRKKRLPAIPALKKYMASRVLDKPDNTPPEDLPAR
jgi:acetoin:2,6-dichlorophenolindophenol oxidoreductase subunit beta